MKKISLKTVVKKIVKGSATEEEKGLFYQFIYFKQQKKIDHHPDLKDKIWNNIENEALAPSGRQVFFTPGLKVAASIVITLGIAITLYLATQSPVEPTYLTKSTTRGQKATITLSDGSVVKLNAESSITYPESFASLDSRDIKLTGEAFFDVKRNPEKPFTIKSGDILTTVLGTSFNISAFPEMDEIEVTVATGRVQVESNNDLVSELRPGQQASYSRSDNLLTVEEVDIRNYTAWKDGTIYLSDMTLLEASKILSRWYNVDFQFDNDKIKDCRIDGKFKNDQLVNVLEILQFVIDFQFQIIDDDVVVIKGKGCK